MKSYNEHKARQFVEATVPHMPSTEMNPIGNGIKHIDRGISKPAEDLDAQTVPSMNSGRKTYEWESFFEKMKDSKAKTPVPVHATLGDLGNKEVGQTTFAQDPVSAAVGKEVTGLKGQFETFDEYLRRRTKLHEFIDTNSFGGPRGQTFEDKGPTHGVPPIAAPNLQGMSPAAMKAHPSVLMQQQQQAMQQTKNKRHSPYTSRLLSRLGGQTN